MSMDGGLRQLFQRRIPHAHWQSVETWSTGRGVPDLNYCLDGCEGWIELKKVTGLRVKMRPEQVAWISRRARAGGRVMIAARKNGTLWLFPARVVADLIDRRVDAVDCLARWEGGPARWDWADVENLLKRRC